MARPQRKNPARRRREKVAKQKAAADEVIKKPTNVLSTLPKPSSSTDTRRACDVPTEVQKHLTLAKLPGELRNSIYRYALLVPERIRVRQDSLAPPGLLSTCRQIRTEASPIYYTENQFTVEFLNLDFSLRFKFMEQRRPYKKVGIKAQLVQIGQGSWQNFMKGLQACHEGRYGGFKDGEDNDIIWKTAVRASDMVQALKGCPWAQVEKALEKFRLAVTEQPGQVRAAWRED